MIVVADSGSTCTDWVIIKQNKIVNNFKTKGFNPYFTKNKEIINELKANFPSSINPDSIKTIHFYGAGCSSQEMNQIIYNELESFFKLSEIEVEHDLLAAARSLFKEKSGIAIILGTGANTCYYNGNEIVKNITSLGFILGDEGGGDYLGKLFIQSLLNKELPYEIENKFMAEYNLNTSQILKAVYKEEYPNRFLSKFATFINKNSDNKEIATLIEKSFDDLFTKHICKYENYQNFKIRATGSIAFYFKEFFEKTALKYNSKIDLIEQTPINGLAQYHINNN